LFENFRENSLKGDLSNYTTPHPPLFSLANTFNERDQFQQTNKYQLFAQLHISANHDEFYVFIRQSYFYEKKLMCFHEKYKHFAKKEREKRE
jgi:hypothetical protein